MYFFGIFKNSSAPNYLEFRKFLAITLKGTVNTFQKKNQRCPKSTHKLPISPFSKYQIFVSPKFPKALVVRACGRETLFNFLSFTCIFRNFQKFISAKLFGISEISCYHLKGDSEYFSQKNQRCPKSTHKLPISPFSKYHKIP